MAPCRRPEFRQFLTPPFLTPHRGAATIDTLAAKAAHPDRACPERSQSPRRLAWPRTSPFHGADAGSNPAGDAKSITYGRNVYSLFNKSTGDRAFPDIR